MKYKVHTSTFDGIDQENEKLAEMLEGINKDLHKILKPVEQELIRKTVIQLIRDIKFIQRTYGIALIVLFIALIGTWIYMLQ